MKFLSFKSITVFFILSGAMFGAQADQNRQQKIQDESQKHAVDASSQEDGVRTFMDQVAILYKDGDLSNESIEKHLGVELIPFSEKENSENFHIRGSKLLAKTSYINRFRDIYTLSLWFYRKYPSKECLHAQDVFQRNQIDYQSYRYVPSEYEKLLMLPDKPLDLTVYTALPLKSGGPRLMLYETKCIDSIGMTNSTKQLKQPAP